MERLLRFFTCSLCCIKSSPPKSPTEHKSQTQKAAGRGIPNQDGGTFFHGVGQVTVENATFSQYIGSGEVEVDPIRANIITYYIPQTLVGLLSLVACRWVQQYVQYKLFHTGRLINYQVTQNAGNESSTQIYDILHINYLISSSLYQRY